MNQYRKRPVVIEAMHYDGTPESNRAIIDWTRHSTTRALMGKDADDNPRLVVDTLEGTMAVKPGDYVIRGVQGEHYPCKPDVFEATYEPADAPARDEAAELRAENERMLEALKAVDSFISHEYHRNGHRLTNKEWAEEVMRKVEGITRRRLAGEGS